MADLQNLRDSLEQFESLEADIAELERKKDGLEQERVTSTAKKKYIDSEIQKATTKLDGVKKNHAQVVTQHNAEIEAMEKCKVTTQNEITELEKAKITAQKAFESSKSELETQLSAKQKEIDDLQESVDALVAQEATLVIDVSDLEKEKQSVEDKISTLQTDLAKYEQQTTAKLAQNAEIQADSITKTKEAQKALKTAEDELAGVLFDIETAQKDLKEVKIKHDGFLENEKRTTKSLEAREESVSEREKALDERERRAQRAGTTV